MATNAFRKESPAVVTHDVTTEAIGEAQRLTSTDVTFDWDDYLEHQSGACRGPPGSADRRRPSSTGLQVSASATFSPLIDEVEVNQSTYTASDRLYPEGTLFWRVQAIDADDNSLSWSSPRTFVKQSRPVPLVTPVDEARGSGTQQLTWAAQPFASAYELQVNKDGDANFSDITKLFANKTVKQVGYVWDSPVPASDQPYWWRVRRKDASGNLGPWSTPRSFVSTGLVPSLTEPAADTVQPNNGPLFTWERVSGAATYLLEVRPTGAGTALPTVTTPANAWATVKAMAPGAWQWRVTARDNASSPKTLGSSEWRTFRVAKQPTASTSPVISGSAKVGTTINASSPTWDIPGVSDAWQWKRDGVTIPGATSPTYDVTTVDAGRALTVTVTGTVNGFDPGTTTSAAVSGIPADAPTATTPAKITGSGKVGTTLTSTLPTWNPSAGVVSSRQWLRNGTPVSAATDATYSVRPGDLGATITVQVTGTLAGHADGSSTSNGVVGVTGDAPTATTAPTVTGGGKVGTSLQASPPAWSVSGVTNAIQWLRDGQPIAGATGTTYAVVAGDVNRSLAVRYTGTSTGGPRPRPSARPSPAVLGDAPAAATSPVLAGSGKVGSTVSVPAASWDLDGVTETLQWMRDGNPITGETSRSHVVTSWGPRPPAQRPGHRHAGGTSCRDRDEQLSRGEPGSSPESTRSPAVAGSTSVGRVLTADPGDWTADPSFTFQWLRNGTVISGATGTTYQVVEPDAGQRLSVRVTASSAGPHLRFSYVPGGGDLSPGVHRQGQSRHPAGSAPPSSGHQGDRRGARHPRPDRHDPHLRRQAAREDADLARGPARHRTHQVRDDPDREARDQGQVLGLDQGPPEDRLGDRQGVAVTSDQSDSIVRKGYFPSYEGSRSMLRSSVDSLHTRA